MTARLQRWSVAFTLAVAPSVAAQSELFVLHHGPADGTEAMADLTGDGIAEVLLFTYESDKTYVDTFSGAGGGLIHRHDIGKGAPVRLAGGRHDHDGDGVPDYAFTFTRISGTKARVVSGADGSALRVIPDVFLGVDLIGDVDGDGLSEVAVAGETRVISSIDGSVLFEVPGLGVWVAGAGDLNADGIPDLLADDASSDELVALSGLDGSEIRRYSTSVGIDSFDAGPDVDGDGVGDILSDSVFGGSDLLSGADGSRIHELARGPSPYRSSFVGDVTGDGVEDVLVVNPFSDDPVDGQAELISGATGERHYMFGYGPSDRTTGPGCALGDVNGDGVGDFALGGDLVRAIAGGRVFLDLWPRFEVEAGDRLEIGTSGGTSGMPALRFVVAVNGAPFTWLVARGVFDVDGRIDEKIDVPAGLDGLDIEFMTFTLDMGGKVVATTVETVRFR